MIKSFGYFILLLLSFLVISMIATIVSPSKESFAEITTSEDSKSDLKMLQLLQHQVASNTIKIKNQFNKHFALTSAINNGLQNFSDFFTRFNDDIANEFEKSGLILYDNNMYSNKTKLKDLIMKGISETYVPIDRGSSDDDNDDDE